METLAGLLPLLLIVAVFWLLILRPAQNRQRAQRQLLGQVSPGQRIMTTAGLLGTVTDVTEDEIGLEIAPGVVVRYVKAAIGQILPEPEPEAGDRAGTGAAASGSAGVDGSDDRDRLPAAGGSRPGSTPTDDDPDPTSAGG